MLKIPSSKFELIAYLIALASLLPLVEAAHAVSQESLDNSPWLIPPTESKQRFSDAEVVTNEQAEALLRLKFERPMENGEDVYIACLADGNRPIRPGWPPKLQSPDRFTENGEDVYIACAGDGNRPIRPGWPPKPQPPLVDS